MRGDSFDAFELHPSQALIETVIGQVQATDADSGTFGQIEYSLSVPSSRYLKAKKAIILINCKLCSLQVNRSTGEISSIANIDQNFSIVIIASDLDSNLTQRNTNAVNVTITCE